MIKILIGGYEKKDEANLRTGVWKAVQRAVCEAKLPNSRIFLRLGEEREEKLTSKGAAK